MRPKILKKIVFIEAALTMATLSVSMLIFWWAATNLPTDTIGGPIPITNILPALLAAILVLVIILTVCVLQPNENEAVATNAP